MKKGVNRNIKQITALCLLLALMAGGCGQTGTGESGDETGSGEVRTEQSRSEESSPAESEDEGQSSSEPDVGYEFVNVNESVFTTMNANLHAAPDETSQVAVVVLKDTYMIRTGYDADWCRVLYEESVYYIQTRYLRLPREGEEIPTVGDIPTGGESIAATPTPAPEESAPTPTPVPDPEVPVGGTLSRDQIAALDNTTIGWGYSTTDRDAYNRPNGCLYYQRLYGKYGAEFIGENTNEIYLTFDEGYEAGYTGQILDTLKEKNATGVFFVTLQYCKQNPELVRRMIDEGHVVGNHSCSHPSGGLPQYGMEYVEEDIMQLHQYVLDNFGYEMWLMRYPEGAFSEQSLAHMQSLGYRCIFWSFAHKDWIVDDQPAVEDTYARVTSQMHNGAIYLLHAVSSSNTAALGDMIDYARANGYEIGHYE